jgi:hypothetical protein
MNEIHDLALQDLGFDAPGLQVFADLIHDNRGGRDFGATDCEDALRFVNLLVIQRRADAHTCA